MMTMTRWIRLGLLSVLLILGSASDVQAQERGWEPLVSESQQGSYERSRYAPVVRIGDMLLASGVIGTTRDGDNGPRAQFRRAFERVSDILDEHGLTLANVAEMTTYHVRLGELGRDFIEVKDEYFPEPPYPAWTAIGVERLFLDDALIEIRFTAAFPEVWDEAGDSEGYSPQPSHVELAQNFRALVRQERYGEARAMMSEDPRRWFAPREGEGRPWRVGPGSGPWSAWDEHFRSEAEVVGWRAGDRLATAVVRETNDYFRLLDRGTVTNEITYFFDDRDSIDGLLIDAVGERPPGQTEAFLAWAREHEPEELRTLMPGREIDPSGDHPQRFRALLIRWRSAAGLEPIPPGRRR